MTEKIQKYGIGITNDLSHIGLVEAEIKQAAVSVLGKYCELEKKDQKYFLKIKKECTNIEVYFKSTEKFGTVELAIEVEEDTHVSIIEHVKVEHFVDVHVSLKVQSGVQMKYSAIQHLEEKKYALVDRFAEVSRGAKIDWFDVQLGGSNTCSNIKTLLVGDGAEVNLYGLFLGNADQVFDMYHEVVHAAPYTKSLLLTKGVLDEKAKTIYRGLIDIKKEARSSRGEQKEDTLLLSKTAEIDTVPNLEIANNDVQCSHGVTVTRVDKEKLFYMQSRGIDQKNAVEMTVMGHLSSVLDVIEDESVKQKIVDKIEHGLNGLNE